jgi:hypothetical protein
MSVRVMGWVWQSSRSKGTDRLVLLAIADCASDDGGNAYPSMSTLVDKTGYGERTVQEAIRRLDKLGELEITAKVGSSNRYRVVMTGGADPAPPQNPHPRRSRTPADPAPRGAVAAPPPPQIPHPGGAATAPITVLEPSVEPSLNQEGRAKTRGTRIPDDFRVTSEMVAWAKGKCPDVNGRLATETFVAYWRGESGAKASKRDWTQAWRVWLLRDQTNASRGRASPGYVERDGMHLKPETAQRLDDRQKWRERDAASQRLALGGAS